MRSARLGLAGLALTLAACGGSASVHTVDSSPKATQMAKVQFAGGLYYIQPSANHPGGSVQILGGAMPVPVEVNGVGFDVRSDLVVWTDAGTATIHLVKPDGDRREVKPVGLYALGRPSLSGDGARLAVQGTAVPFVPGQQANPMQDTIYVVDLPTGTWHRVGPVPVAGEPSTQAEQPGFFPDGSRVAYWASENKCLVVKVADAASGEVKLTIKRGGTSGCYQPTRGIADGPRFHIAVSADSTKILIAGQMQVYDATSGALLTDLHQAVLSGLAGSGYQIDARFAGAGGGGTYPLSGTFSPDGSQIAFDGAVVKDGVYGVLLCSINSDGTGFKVLGAMSPADPRFSNNHNFSQLLPHWR